jgi:hypothetical protein
MKLGLAVGKIPRVGGCGTESDGLEISLIINAREGMRYLPPFDSKAAPGADFGAKALENLSPSVHNKYRYCAAPRRPICVGRSY